MPKAYSYIRMSRPEQMRGDSLRRQLEAAQAWAAERGIELDDTLRDIGVSAYRGQNRDEGALRRFLDLVEAGDVARGSYLIVESLDRLSREAVLEALPRFLDLVRAGITIVTLADQQVYSADRLKTDWTPLILSLAVMARAHEESRMKGERVGAAWAEKRRRAAEKPLTSRVPEWLRLVGDKIEPIPERARVVRRIFQMTADGYGKRGVAMTLNREGVPAFRSKRGWHPSYIGKILDNRATIGEYQPHRLIEGRRVPEGEPVLGYYPAVISEDLFWRAQAARKRRAAVPGRRGAEFSNLLQGLAHCRICGGRMVMLNKGQPPKGGRYLACSNQMRRAGCTNAKRWRYERVESAVLSRVTELDVTAVLDGSEAEDVTPHIQDIRAALADAERKRKRWAKLVDDGDDLAVERYRSATAEVRRIKKTLADATRLAAEQEADGPLTNRLDAVRRLRQALETATPTERRDLRARLAEALRRLLERVDFSEHGVIARYREGIVPNYSPLRPGVRTPVIIDNHPDTIAMMLDQAAADEEREAEEAERAAKLLAQLGRRKTAKAK